MVVVISYEDDLPLFALIKFIVKPLREYEKAWFVLSGLHTVGFSDHLQCFEVKSTTEWFFVEYEDLISFYPTTCCIGGDRLLYVSFKYQL